MASTSRSACLQVCFPDSVLIKILARLPFPEILNVRLLSKTWAIRFLDRERAVDRSVKLEMDPLVVVGGSFTDFQTEVASVSSGWPKYFPVLRTQHVGFLAWDKRLTAWKRFGIPQVIRSFPNEDSLQIWTFFGSILCRMWCVGRTLYRVQLANLITGSSFSTTTHPSPVMQDGKRKLPRAVHLVQGDEICDFKILLVYERDQLFETAKRGSQEETQARLRLTLQIYASDTRSWKVVTHEINTGPALASVHYSNSVCFGDNLYAVFATSIRSHVLLCKFNVSTEHWTNILRTPRSSEHWRLRDLLITSSSGREFGATFIYEKYPFIADSLRSLHRFSTLKVDETTLEVISSTTPSPLSYKGPVATKIEDHEKGAYGDRHSSIYVIEPHVRDRDSEPPTLWYFDIVENTWMEFSEIPDGLIPEVASEYSSDPLYCVPSTFAPGMNPFAAWRDRGTAK